MSGARHAVAGRPVTLGLGGTGGGGFRVEGNGINVIVDAERRGRPRQLFWPWFGANVSVLGLSYGAFVLDFGISLRQAVLAGLGGIAFSFLLCGFVALAGKRGSAPTMVLSRAAFGVRGNRIPSAISWMLTVGWETVLTITATLATATVFARLGWGGGPRIQVIALAVVVLLTVGAGVLGFDVIMRLQTVITIVTAVLTVVYIALIAPTIDLAAVGAIADGPPGAVVGAVVFCMTGFGLGWVNVAADYSRYLPRSSSSRGVIGWTTLGCSVAPAVLLVMGLLLAGSSPDLATAISTDPIGALATILPTWFLVPFVVVAVIGLVSGALLDIYSSGLSLLSLGLPASRPVAAGIDGVLMVFGAIYVLFISTGFFFQFQGFLITLGVPISAWVGVFLADLLLRKRDYDDQALGDPQGRYGSVRWPALAVFAVGTVVGWGLVTNTYAGWLSWQGYLMGVIGGKDGDWAYASIGVVVALVIGFVGYLALESRTVAASEAR